MVSRALLTSNTVEWATPQDLFDDLNAEFGFTLDVCATPENAKCARYFTPEVDGLSKSWAGETVWMNPPYGRAIGAWVSKARGESFEPNTTVVCLLPSRTDTRWWHHWVQPNLIAKPSDVRFVRGRLKFGGASNSAPFPSVIVVMRGAP